MKRDVEIDTVAKQTDQALGMNWRKISQAVLLSMICCTSGGYTLDDICTGIPEYLGDGHCDRLNNIEQCDFDQGDCCECTCLDGDYFSCGSNGFNCVDPNSDCLDPIVFEYPNCTGYLPDMKDGYCDGHLNNIECAFDGGDCCECTFVGDAYSSDSNRFACLDTNSSCLDPRANEFPNCTGDLGYAANGWCDDFNNNPGCGFDWGDCCLCTVNEDPTDGSYLVDIFSSYSEMFDCVDPNAAEDLYDCKVTPPPPLPCVADGDGPIVVESLADVSVMAETVFCAGGEFEVIWRDHIVLDHGIVVPDGTVVNVTGVGHNATIDGGGITRLFSVVNAFLHVTDVIMTNGNSVSGGAIYSSSSTLTFHQSIFSGNKASLNGGALLVSDGSNVSFRDTTFSANRASFAGGALHLTNDSSASWAGVTTFLGNIADHYGGAVHISDGSKASWKGVTRFSGNGAHSMGGAVSMASGNAAGAGTLIFSGNSAKLTGGAIFMTSSNASWAGMTKFLGNIAGSGGAVYVMFGEVSWAGRSSFVGNIAHYSGGALAVFSQVRCSSTAEADLSSNVSGKGGGAVYVTNGGEVYWGADALFFNNTAEAGGGLLVMGGSNTEWSGQTNFTANTAYLDGGAIASTPFEQSDRLNDVESVLVFKGPTYLVDNKAGANGGGIALLGALSIYFQSTEVTFDGNVAKISGGGVHISATGKGPIFHGTKFDSNSAQIGGGVSATGSGTAVIAETVIEEHYPTKFIECTFVNNVANTTGGAVNTASGKDEFLSSSFEGNSAGVGGALRLAGEAFLSNCSFDENVSNSDGGPAVSNIGFVSNLTNGHFSGNKFRCEAQNFFWFRESREENLYGKVCVGCPTNYIGCAFDTPDMIPQCISLSEAGVEHASSSGGLSTVEDLWIFEGYWRATNTSTDVKKCYNADACAGGLTMNSHSCNPGYRGPYCAVCSKGYVTSLGLICKECSDITGGIAVASIFTVACVAVLAAVLRYLLSSKTQRARQGIMGRMSLHFPLQSAKIIIVAWQILTQFSSVANVIFPNVYQDFLDAVNFLNLDLSWIVSPGCFMDYDFYARLLLTTIGPVVAIGLLGVTYAIAASKKRTSDIALRIVRQKHAFVALLVLFFIYSNVSSVVFQTFDCDSLDDGNSYLRADYSIECNNKVHKSFKIYAAITILVYPVGIPALYAGLLFRNRHVLQDETRSQENLLAKSTVNLWEPYKPSLYYYEVIECLRRIMLTGVVVFIYPDSAAQIAVALTMAAVFAMVAEILAPYKSRWDTWVSRAGHALVTMSIYLALLLKVDVSDEDSGSQKIFEFVLLTAHTVVVVAVIVEAVSMAFALRETRQLPDPLRRTGN